MGGHVQETLNQEYDIFSVINKIANDLSLLDLEGDFNIELSDYIQPAATVNVAPLPPQPMPTSSTRKHDGIRFDSSRKRFII